MTNIFVNKKLDGINYRLQCLNARYISTSRSIIYSSALWKIKLFMILYSKKSNCRV